MTVHDLIEMLKCVGDDEMEVYLPLNGRFVPVCAVDSGEALANDSEMIFVFKPCFCNTTGETITVEAHSTDFGEIKLN